MENDIILQLVKARLGISGSIRDGYLKAIIEGVLSELKTVNDLALDENRSDQRMFICDFSVWRYQSVDSSKSMPDHLRLRLNNLIIEDGGAANG